MNGIMAINMAVGSTTLDDEQGPERPWGTVFDKRPSRTPSNSTVFGGSCFVASFAAYLQLELVME